METTLKFLKNILFISFQFIMYNTQSQERTISLVKIPTDTGAFKSEIRFGNIRGSIASQLNLQSALNAKENSITTGSTTQYWRGDKTWQVLNKSTVGLPNVDNTTDLGKPVSTATQTALNAKEPSISAGNILDYWRGDKTWQPLPINNYMLKFGGQARQDTITQSGVYAGIGSLSGSGNEDYNTVSFNVSQWGTGLQLQSAIYTDNYYIRRRVGGVWLDWKELATIDYINTKAFTTAYTISHIQSGFTVNNYSLRRFGNVCNLTMNFTYSGSSIASTQALLCEVAPASNPTSTVYGSCTSEVANYNYTGSVEISTSGHVLVYLKGTGVAYNLNITWIIFQP